MQGARDCLCVAPAMTNQERSRVVNKKKLALGVWLLDRLKFFNFYPSKSYRLYVAVLTFICYTSYRMSRKPFSVVASVLAPNCTVLESELEDDEPSEDALDGEVGWSPFNGTHCKTLIGAVDYSWLFTYAVFTIGSGFIADRVNLRYFLTVGMIGSGVFVGLLGVAYFAEIHHIAYFIVVQIFVGVFECTGWPGTVAVMGNWFGKKNRGLFLGIWNTHTSLGNILGTAIPSIWAQPGKAWAWSFLVPALVMIIVGIIIFFFLVTDPAHVGLPPPEHHLGQMNTGVANGQPSSEYTQSSNDSNGSHQSPPGSPALNEATDKYQTFSISEKEGESDVGEEIQLIDNDLGLGNGRVMITEETTKDSDLEGKPVNKKTAISLFQAFRVPGVLEYAIAFFFAKLVAYTFLFWLPYYITFNRIGGKYVGAQTADLMATLYDVGGIFGGIITGAMSDFLNARAISSVIMMYLAVPTLFIYRSFGDTSIAVSGVLIIFCGMFINGPYTLITTAVSNDLGTHKSLQANQKAKATVGAIIDAFGSLGAASGPLITGWVSDDYGWNSAFYVLMAACFFSSVMLSRLLFGEFRYFYKKLIDVTRRAEPENQQSLVSNQGEESKL